MHEVHTRAKLVVIAKATTRIQRGANLGIRGVVHTHFRLRVSPACFGSRLIIPPTPELAAPFIRELAFEDLDAVDHLGIHHLTRQYAGQSAKSHVVAVKLQAANAEGFRAVAVP